MRHFFRCILPSLVILGLPSSSAFAQAERIDPIPEGPEDIVKALSPFRGNPDSSKVAKLLGEQAEDSDFPTSDLDHVLVARLWRRAGQPDLAMRSLEQVGGESEAANLAMYEAARVLLESGTNPRGGRQAYWIACGTADERVRAEIEWDLLPVSTPEEREDWSTEPVRENCEWLREFWSERAVRMAVTVDERVATHYQRLVIARKWFWIPRPRFQEGPADRHGRPEGIAVDDRGLIFIRMGPPETNEGFLGSAGSDFDFGDLDETSQQSTCWPFLRKDGYRIFCFAQGSDRSDGDYRITEKIGGVPGTQFFHKYVANSNLPQSAIDEIVRARGRAVAARVRDPTQVELGDFGAIETVAGGLKVAVATRDNIDLALKQAPDAPMVISTLNLRFETLRFLNPSVGQWQVWILSSVRAGDLTPSSEDEDAAELDVGGRYAALTGEGLSVQSFLPRSFPASALSEDAGISLRGTLTADPGPLLLTVVIEDLNASGDGAWIQDTVHVPAIGGLPQLSDIAVAQAKGGTWTRDGVTFLQVSPAHMTNPDGSIHTYFEVYGVQPGTSYDVELRLMRADDASEIWRRSANDLAFRLQFRADMSGDIGRHHLRLELGDTKPGEYTLAVRIQDADSGAYSLPAITDLFVAER